VLVSVLVLVLFKYSIVDTVVSASLEEDVDEVRDDEKNRNDTRDLEGSVVKALE
jgi:hypothetical protein